MPSTRGSRPTHKVSRGHQAVRTLPAVPLVTVHRAHQLATGTLEMSLERGAEIGAGEDITMGTFERVRDQLFRSLGVRDASVDPASWQRRISATLSALEGE